MASPGLGRKVRKLRGLTWGATLAADLGCESVYLSGPSRNAKNARHGNRYPSRPEGLLGWGHVS